MKHEINSSVSVQQYIATKHTMGDISVADWTTHDTRIWLEKEGLSTKTINILCEEENIDGKCLLSLTECDFRITPLDSLTLRDRKHLYIAVKNLQRDNHACLIQMGVLELGNLSLYPAQYHRHEVSDYCDSERCDRVTPPMSEDGRAVRLKPEVWKAFLSMCYVVVVTWITAFVMVIVHDRVPDMKRYPPLPDIFLDNVPHIPWAFDMCEITGTVMFTIWLFVIIFHKHRFILVRRFFALSGTVFLLRCVTMLITSLSVPGTHLQCRPRSYSASVLGGAAGDLGGGAEPRGLHAELAQKVAQAYVIWRGAGMSIQGVRTCGDYMFSGHTVALTMLNFFITEYTPRNLYFLHTMTWLMNMFGIFFILAAHEHYSIDVFIAFYITSRLFLYYHTLSNNQALMQRDSTRTKIWFPLFSFFESSVECIVPNEFETPGEIITTIYHVVKDSCINVWHSILPFVTVRQSLVRQNEEQKNK